WRAVVFSAGGGGGRGLLELPRNPRTSFVAASDCRTIAVYEYTPFCNGPGDVKSPRVMSRRRAHASVRGRRRGRHTMLSEGTVSLSSRPLRSRFEGWPNCEGLE